LSLREHRSVYRLAWLARRRNGRAVSRCRHVPPSAGQIFLEQKPPVRIERPP
jgi:hypothetical protein